MSIIHGCDRSHLPVLLSSAFTQTNALLLKAAAAAGRKTKKKGQFDLNKKRRQREGTGVWFGSGLHLEILQSGFLSGSRNNCREFGKKRKCALELVYIYLKVTTYLTGVQLLLLQTRARLRGAEISLASAPLQSLYFLCFPGISTMSTPWMTGVRPSVGCKCRSSSSWSCRYCLGVYFGPNIYVSSSPIISAPSAEPLPVCLISAMGSLTEGSSSIILYICK